MMAPSSKTLAQDVAGLYVLPGRAELVRTSVLNVYESKKEHRRAVAAAVGASIKLSFDFTLEKASCPSKSHENPFSHSIHRRLPLEPY